MPRYLPAIVTSVALCAAAGGLGWLLLSDPVEATSVERDANRPVRESAQSATASNRPSHTGISKDSEAPALVREPSIQAAAANGVPTPYPPTATRAPLPPVPAQPAAQHDANPPHDAPLPSSVDTLFEALDEGTVVAEMDSPADSAIPEPPPAPPTQALTEEDLQVHATRMTRLQKRYLELDERLARLGKD